MINRSLAEELAIPQVYKGALKQDTWNIENRKIIMQMFIIQKTGGNREKHKYFLIIFILLIEIFLCNEEETG